MVTQPTRTTETLPGSEAPRTLDRLLEQLSPIRVLDTCDRVLPAAWEPLADHLRSVICSPLPEPPEGTHDGTDARGHRTVRPSALSIYGGEDQLNVTRDPRRSSLLEPNRAVVARHGEAAGFEVLDRRTVRTETPGDLAAEHGPFDVIRLKTQGMEYPLLSSSLATVRGAVCVEVEGGLVENYVGQYPFAVVDPLMHGAGYSLMSLSTFSRPDAAWANSPHHRPAEYRAVWFKDDLIYSTRETSFEQAVKLLLICKALGHHPFGHELAVSLHDRSLLPWDVARVLRTERFWSMPWTRP